MSPVSDSDKTESASVNIVDLAGGIAITPNDAPENDYAWLDYIDEDNCFMPLALDDSQPSKTLDFGCDGYTGSLSTWHELMQITAPDAQCGLVFVRGDFPDHPDAILARAQRRNQRGTFGMTIHIPDKQEWAQEPTPAQGLVNLRWPYTRFNWVREGEAGGAPFATFTVCSFVEDGTLYQIARIVPKMLTRPSPAASSVNLADRQSTTQKSIEFEVDVGGLVRFGCPSTVGSANCSTTPTDEASRVFEDVYSRSIKVPEIPKTAKNPKDVAAVYTCTSTHHEKRLEIRLWIDHVPQNPSECRHGCDAAHPKEVASVHIRKKVDFDSKKITIIVAAFRLVDSDVELKPMTSVGYNEVMMHLGVADNSPHAPYRLWSALLGSSSSADSFELNTVARSVEAILGVASVPVASCKTGGPASIALIKNIITPQVVDLESAFWQVRLLITAAEKMNDKLQWESLSHVRGLEGHYERMQNGYREKVVNHIRGFCIWLLDLFDSIREFDEPSPQIRDPGVGILPSDIHPNNKRQCRPDSGSQSPPIGDQKYYSAIIISYVLRRLPEVFNEPDVQGELWKKASSLFGVQTSYKSSTSTKTKQSVSMDDPNGCIIRWYHNHALLQICQWLQEKHVEEFKKDTPEYLLSLLYPQSSRPRKPDESSSSQSAQQSSGPPGNTAAEDEKPPKAVPTTTGSSQDSDHSVISNQEPRPDVRSDTANQAPDSQKTTEARPRTLGKIKIRMDDWQAKAEKAMRLFEQGRLRGRELGHETANLANIVKELGIKPTAITLSGVSCIELSKSLIKRRKATKKLNAGRAHIMRWDPQHDIRSAKPRPAPWELSCLAQHLPYVLGCGDCQKDKCLERIRMFMFSDYSFMGSWDPSKATIVGQWWDYLTTCIVSAKLLQDSMPGGQKQRNTSPQLVTASESTDALTREGLDLLRDIHELQKRTNAKTDLVFQWKLLRPKQLYHADSSVLSVEDTPSIQKMHQRPDADVLATRLNLHRYFEHYVLPGRVDTLRTIESNIGASKLHNLSCLDIVLVTDRNDQPETSRPIIRGRAESGFWDEWIQGDVQRGKLHKLFVNTQAGGLKDLYLIGKPEAHPFYKKNQEVLADKTIRDDLLDKYRKRLFTRLNDCLVDQKVKCRVLFAKRLSPITLQAIVYMWHPEAIDTFDVHLGELSSFRDIIDQSITGSDNTWISSITIKHWRLLGDAETMVRKAEKDVDEDERIARWNEKNLPGDKAAWWSFRRRRVDPSMKPATKNGDGSITAKPIAEHDKDCDFPPPGVRDEREGSPVLLWNMHELNKIHELSVSMAITGDVMGRGWTCSIICELFDEQDVINYTNQASYILQMFIHQQDSARALVFLMLLGNICLALAKECGKFTGELNGVMKLNSQVLVNGLEWEKSDRALKKLKQMLWGYESLRGCSDMLNRAIDEIRRARDKMNKRLEEGSAIRHEEMKSAALQIQEEFEKKFSLLEAACHGVQQRVEQGDKLREGIASVLGVEQNENISMLTWLTIIYLGPSLVVGLFGMGDNAILNDNSSTTFYRLLGGLLGGTVLFALCLSTIITIIRFFWRHVTRPLERVWEMSQHRIRDKATFWWKYRKFLFWTWLVGASREQQRAAQRDEDVEKSPVGRDESVAAAASPQI